MNCSNKLNDQSKQRSTCNNDVSAQFQKGVAKHKILLLIIMTLSLSICISCSLSWNTLGTNLSSEKLFYLKGDKVYYTAIGDIKPKQVIENLYRNDNNELSPLFLSDNGKWLFYPQKDKELNIYGYQFKRRKSEPKLVAKDVDIFTTNKTGSNLYYLSRGNLLVGNDLIYTSIDNDVVRYFVNKNCDSVVYLKKNEELYIQKGDKDKELLDSNVTLKYVSDDLNTIYYMKNGSFFLIKNGQELLKVSEGNATLLAVYENGDIYFRSKDLKGNPAVFYYSNGKAKLIGQSSKGFTAIWGEDGRKFIYPYGGFSGGTNPPIAIFEDSSGSLVVCNGDQVIGRIPDVNLLDGTINKKGNEIYYLNQKGDDYYDNDLYHISINGTTVSSPKKIASGVGYFLNYYNDGDFGYFKNVEVENFTADLYMNGQMVDSGVYMWFYRHLEAPNTFVYLKNIAGSKSKSKSETNTLMMYQNTKLIKIADQVYDCKVYGDNLVYLTYSNPNEKVGELHLYTAKGEDILIDQDVTQMLEPKTDREDGGEVNSSLRIKNQPAAD